MAENLIIQKHPLWKKSILTLFVIVYIILAIGLLTDRAYGSVIFLCLVAAAHYPKYYARPIWCTPLYFLICTALVFGVFCDVNDSGVLNEKNNWIILAGFVVGALFLSGLYDVDGDDDKKDKLAKETQTIRRFSKPEPSDDIDYREPVEYDTASAYTFDYKDEEGVSTKGRKVSDPLLSEQNGKYYLQGYCQTRRAVRTFRLDRMRNVVDMDTGEFFKYGKQILG